MTTKWWSPKRTGVECGVSDETIRRWCREGKLPAVKVGRDFKISPDDVAALLGASVVAS